MDGDLDISQLLALIKPLEPRRVGGDNLSGPGLGDEGWDGSISFNTYDDYKTPYGTFTIHDYHEEGGCVERAYTLRTSHERKS